MSYYAYNPYVVTHQDSDYFKRNDFLTRFINYLSDQMSSFLTTSETKPQIIAYAAGAGLAAGVLIYVFGPTFFIDGNSMNGNVVAGGSGKRKQTVVGLYNPANDCFVNSVLQALAGCGELRKFLGGRMGVQGELEEFEGNGRVVWKGRRPVLTRALKVMLDKLNERPLHRKTISTRDFIYELERVFRSRISRNQQDAQEFLQIVAQTLAEEYESQEKVRLMVKNVEEGNEKEEEESDEEEETDDDNEEGEVDKEKEKENAKVEVEKQEDDTSEHSFEVVTAGDEQSEEVKGAEADISTVESVKSTTEEPESTATELSTPETSNDEGESSFTDTDQESSKPKQKHVSLDTKIKELEKEEAEAEKEKTEKEEPKIPEFGMPMEGKLESGIQCLVCGFEPKPTGSTFVVLTLNVPMKSSATLDDCFNEHLSTEFIDDFQCAKCKLAKMIAVQEKKLATTKDEKESSALKDSLETLNDCLKNNPEEIPKDTLLPSPKLTTVKSRIAKRTYFAHCPNVLAIHLSRSIFDYYSRKNSCKVAFPEELLLGPLLNRSKYKLLGLITHRGSHDSGHYECYRRQNSHPPPYSTPMTMMMPKGEVGTPVTPVTPATLETPASQIQTQTPTTPTPTPTPGTSQLNLGEKTGESSNGDSTPAASATVSASASVLQLDEKKKVVTTGSALPTGSEKVVATSAGKASKVDTLSLKSFPSKGKKAKGVDSRWWRISDDSVKEVKTNDVLGLQKEVYLLFYEKVHPER
ncbi:hypothetical protein TWF192_001197 [Orbilia oligospora]|uniref:Ubiquitin carboxyl-terminal hydrolase n=1 Tax=Orbilia oligospora TaxID=2813651 RepID=A0A6G1LW78_ORBOL|nr:hypothetical protein TWF191_009933 [Orbilia oligospora]KAF3234817.1 hypothetical protein TWF192_001197 [Orbilia oligospora]